MNPIEESDRYLNLAMINIGEAVTAVSNLRQRGAKAGSDMAIAATSLMKAVSALGGRAYEAPPPAPQHVEPDDTFHRRQMVEKSQRGDS